MTTRQSIERGLTLIEVLGSLAIGALLFAALGGVALQSTRALGLATAGSGRCRRTRSSRSIAWSTPCGRRAAC